MEIQQHSEDAVTMKDGERTEYQGRALEDVLKKYLHLDKVRLLPCGAPRSHPARTVSDGSTLPSRQVRSSSTPHVVTNKSLWRW